MPTLTLPRSFILRHNLTPLPLANQTKNGAASTYPGEAKACTGSHGTGGGARSPYGNTGEGRLAGTGAAESPGERKAPIRDDAPRIGGLLVVKLK